MVPQVGPTHALERQGEPAERRADGIAPVGGEPIPSPPTATGKAERIVNAPSSLLPSRFSSPSRGPGTEGPDPGTKRSPREPGVDHLSASNFLVALDGALDPRWRSQENSPLTPGLFLNEWMSRVNPTTLLNLTRGPKTTTKRVVRGRPPPSLPYLFLSPLPPHNVSFFPPRVSLKTATCPFYLYFRKTGTDIDPRRTSNPCKNIFHHSEVLLLPYPSGPLDKVTHLNCLTSTKVRSEMEVSYEFYRVVNG